MLDYQINDELSKAYGKVKVNEGETWDKVKNFAKRAADAYTVTDPNTGEKSINWKELGSDAFDTITDTYVDPTTGERKVDKLGLGIDLALGLGSLGAAATGIGATAGAAGAATLGAKYGGKMAAKMAAKAAAKAAAKEAGEGIIKKGAKNLARGVGKALTQSPFNTAEKILNTKARNLVYELPIVAGGNMVVSGLGGDDDDIDYEQLKAALAADEDESSSSSTAQTSQQTNQQEYEVSSNEDDGQELNSLINSLSDEELDQLVNML